MPGHADLSTRPSSWRSSVQRYRIKDPFGEALSYNDEQAMLDAHPLWIAFFTR